jgi:predicted DCC family thiol-disulfide oxidoreductase YuxK
VERVSVLYDEDCGFCRWSAARLRSWDRRHALRFVPIQSAQGQALLEPIPAHRRLDSMHAITPDGRVWSAGAAAVPILRRLPAGAPLATAAAALPGLTDLVYRRVAGHRERLGAMLGQEACRVDPSVEPGA